MSHGIERLLLIPDGHRRYATRSGLAVDTAYLRGAEVGARIVEGCLDDGFVRRLTLYPLAKKNFVERSAAALVAIAAALDHFLQQVATLAARGLKLTYRGSLARLPAPTRQKVEQMSDASSERTRCSLALELLIDYSGTEELAGLTKRDIETRLADPFDIVLRTGGHFRLSDAPVLECFPAELVTLDKLFPETTYLDIRAAVNSVKAERARRDALICQPEPPLDA